MACCGCGNTTCRGPAGPAGPTSATVIFSQSDLPSPAGGVITLAADTTYWIAGDVTIDDGVAVQMSSGTCLIGNGKYCSRLIGDVDGAAFVRGPSSLDMNIEDLGIENDGTGFVVSHDGGGVADSHLINVLLDGNLTSTVLLSLTAVDEVDLHNVDFLNATGVNRAVALNGTSNKIDVESSLFYGDLFMAAAAVIDVLRVHGNRFEDSGIDLDGTTLNQLQMAANYFDLTTAGRIAWAVDAALTVTTAIFDDNLVESAAGTNGITNAGTVTDATVNGNTFTGGGTYFNAGASPCTDGWEYEGNIGVRNTLFGGLLRATASPAVPVGPVSAAAIVPALDPGSCHFQLGAGADANKLAYTGNKNILARIEAIISGTTAAGADVDAQILVNGATVGGAVTARIGTTSTILVVSAVVQLAPGAVIDVNITTTNLNALIDYQLSAAA